MIRPATERDTAAEESIGWWIVRDRDEKAAWGPFRSYTAAKDELSNHHGYDTHSVDDTKLVFIDHGWCDDGQFRELH